MGFIDAADFEKYEISTNKSNDVHKWNDF